MNTYANGEPNWSYIPTAGKSNKTQEEFIDSIKALADKAATATNKLELDTISKQLVHLRAEYL